MSSQPRAGVPPLRPQHRLGAAPPNKKITYIHLVASCQTKHVKWVSDWLGQWLQIETIQNRLVLKSTDWLQREAKQKVSVLLCVLPGFWAHMHFIRSCYAVGWIMLFQQHETIPRPEKRENSKNVLLWFKEQPMHNTTIDCCGSKVLKTQLKLHPHEPIFPRQIHPCQFFVKSKLCQFGGQFSRYFFSKWKKTEISA